MIRAFRVAVLGGGISGLAAAYRCRELTSARGLHLDLTILEGADRIGGCIETRYEADCVMDLGPDSLVAHKPAALALVERLGLGGALVRTPAAYRGARVLRGGRLLAIPNGFPFFAPTSFVTLATSGLFTPAGFVRAAAEPFIRPKGSDDDESLASFVTRRFGREVLDRLAQPLVASIYSGDPQRLSMQATLPQLLALERRYGSLVRGMRAMRSTTGAPAAQPLLSLRDGLGSLVAALHRELHDSISLSSHVAALRRTPPTESTPAWEIVLANGDLVHADAVICALPAHTSARILQQLSPQLSRALQSIPYHSVATATLAFAARSVPALPRSTGFVVPHTEGRAVSAVTFSSYKYPHRSPKDLTILRAFIGGALQPELLALNDTQLHAAVLRDLRDILGIEALPELSIIRRWPAALPAYEVGHTALIDRIENMVSAIDGLALAGSAYRGVGIADCIRSGERAAETILHEAAAPISSGDVRSCKQDALQARY